MDKVGEHKTEVKGRIEARGRLALRNKGKTMSKEDTIGTKTYSHGPIDYAKILKLRFPVGDLNLPETRDIVVGWRRKKAHRASHVTKQTRVQPTR